MEWFGVLPPHEARTGLAAGLLFPTGWCWSWPSRRSRLTTVRQRQANTKKAPGFPLRAGTFGGNCPLLSPIFLEQDRIKGFDRRGAKRLDRLRAVGLNHFERQPLEVIYLSI
jgi:hypothetical protein